MHILTVCTHNYFRSQITAHLLAARGYADVRSAGVATAYIGQPPHPLVLAAITGAGAIPTAYAARQITATDVAWADVILCAERCHADTIAGTYDCHSELVVMDIPDDGVDVPSAVMLATEKIVAFLDKWCR